MSSPAFHLEGGGLPALIVPKRVLGRSRLLVVLVAWVPLAGLSLIDGTAFGSSLHIPFFADPLPYARFLIALPLFFSAKYWIAPRLQGTVDYLNGSGVLVGDDRAQFEAATQDAVRRSNWVAADVVLLLTSFGLSWLIAHLQVNDGFATWFSLDAGSGEQMTRAGWWYTVVSLPLFQFGLFRVLWRGVLWCFVLKRLAQLNLNLVPTHPDRAGGLGVLEMAQFSFVVLAFGLSAVGAAEIADTKTRDTFDLMSALPLVLGFVVVAVFWIFGPLLMFTGKLVRAKEQGIVAYGWLGEVLFGDFQTKWTKRDRQEQDKLLGNVDPSSLADFGYAYEVVTEMRAIPIRRNLVMLTVAITLAPFLPLLLMQYSLKEIIRQMLGVLG